MTTQTDYLFPCPFCGGAPKVTERASTETATGEFWFIACFCGGYSACAHKDGDTEEKTYKAWNSRASATSAPEQPADDESAGTATYGDALRFADAIDPWVRKKAPDFLTLSCAAKTLRAFAQPATPQPAEPCMWLESDPWGVMPNTYEASCGELWSFTEGGPVENSVKFCHGCGKPVLVEPFTPQPAEGA